MAVVEGGGMCRILVAGKGGKRWQGYWVGRIVCFLRFLVS